MIFVESVSGLGHLRYYVDRVNSVLAVVRQRANTIFGIIAVKITRTGKAASARTGRMAINETETIKPSHLKR